MDLLRLKLYPTHPVHKIDTDEAVWQTIWGAISDRQLMYVRRPVRAAETAISSIVLALGTTMPPPPPQPAERPVIEAPTRPVLVNPIPLPEGATVQPVLTTERPSVLGRDSIALDPSVFRSLSDGGRVIEDEGSVLLRFINVRRLAEIRPAEDSTSLKAIEKFDSEYGKDMKTVLLANEFLLRVERLFDALVWPTLLVLAQKDALPRMLERLKDSKPVPQATGEAVLETGAEAGMTETLQKKWKTLLEQTR
jgi:hypothetical protein